MASCMRLSHRNANNTQVQLIIMLLPLPRGGTDLDRVESRSDFPNFAAALDYVRPRHDGVPSGVTLPNYLIEGPLTWPGQHSGFLGPKFDPWQINGDPNDENFRMQALAMREGLSPSRLSSRQELLEQLNSSRQPFNGVDASSLHDQQVIAFNLLTSGRMVDAFELTLFNALGVDQGVTIADPLNRPHHLLNGTVISPLYTGGTI